MFICVFSRQEVEIYGKVIKFDSSRVEVVLVLMHNVLFKETALPISLLYQVSYPDLPGQSAKASKVLQVDTTRSYCHIPRDRNIEHVHPELVVCQHRSAVKTYRVSRVSRYVNDGRWYIGTLVHWYVLDVIAFMVCVQWGMSIKDSNKICTLQT